MEIDINTSTKFFNNFLTFTPYNTSEISIVKREEFDKIIIEKFNVINAIIYPHIFVEEIVYVLSKNNL
jgi:hypothetical protein